MQPSSVDSIRRLQCDRSNEAEAHECSSTGASLHWRIRELCVRECSGDPMRSFCYFVMIAEGEVLNTCLPHSMKLDCRHDRNIVDGLNEFDAVSVVKVPVDQ